MNLQADQFDALRVPEQRTDQKEMRILYHHRTRADGAEGVHIAEMIRAFRRVGHEVRLDALAGGDPDAPRAAQAGATRKPSALGLSSLLPGFAYELAEYAYNVPAKRRLLRAAAEFKPDILYDRYNSFTIAGQKAARQLGIPHILEVNAPVAYERSNYDGRGLVFKRWALGIETRVMSSADHVIVVSTPLKEHLVGIGVDPDKITVMPNGADEKRFHPGIDGTPVRERHGIGDRSVVGFVGILRPWHGVEMLVDAFAAADPVARNMHLLIVGDGPGEEAIKQGMADRGLADRATFAGRLPHDAVIEHVAAMDIAVSPRATFYASPMKLLEYMAIGTAVVAPDMSNIRDIIEPGKEGVLFEPESTESLTAALTRLADSDELRARIGSAGRAKIEKERNWRQNAIDVVKIVEGLNSD